MPEPRRIRLSRQKGWRKPEVAAVVSRPGRFGNPFTLEWARLADPDMTDVDARAYAVAAFRAWLTDKAWGAPFPALEQRRARILTDLHLLVGRDLCCWCSLPANGEVDQCHARVLLDLAVDSARPVMEGS